MSIDLDQPPTEHFGYVDGISFAPSISFLTSLS